MSLGVFSRCSDAHDGVLCTVHDAYLCERCGFDALFATHEMGEFLMFTKAASNDGVKFGWNI